ncbi:heterokaryon incompatibility protein-domain-containing protein [Circinella umbellata]|nr:heterokaryon incompatibility protein-domain-containing protein [Circinella umbellata]
MYITYESPQWTIENRIIKKYSQPHKRIPTEIPKPNFLPSKLVRTYDMQVVPGNQVNEGYCALSYSWNQSGEINFDKTTGKSTRIDQGKHIIKRDYTPNINNHGNNQYSNNNNNPIEEWWHTFIINNDYFKSTKQKEKEKEQPKHVSYYVPFQDIIKHICHDFNIKYIWFDQMCINQNDQQEKHQEIQHMHRIYNNAYCTVALVPEFNLKVQDDTKKHNNNSHVDILMYDDAERKIHEESQWFKRLWTLEETVKSQELLFIGQNVHVWAQDTHPFKRVHTIFNKSSEELSLRHILFYAHMRTSTNDHDRVYALANLFPDIMQKLDIDYDQSLNDLIIRFYGLLAEKDITILFFGGHNEYKHIGRVKDTTTTRTNTTDNKYKVPIQQFNLPSWTSVHGEHIFIDDHITSTFTDYSISGRSMLVKCTGISNEQQSYRMENDTISSFTIQQEDIPPIPDNHHFWRLGITAQLFSNQPNHVATKAISLNTSYLDTKKIKNLNRISKTLCNLSNFMKINKKSLYWYTQEGTGVEQKQMISGTTSCSSSITEEGVHINEPASISFLLTEDIKFNTSAQYVILSGIPFKNHTESNRALSFKERNKNYYPVITKDSVDTNHYRAIGTCEIIHPDYLFSDCNNLSNPRTYLIQ